MNRSDVERIQVQFQPDVFDAFKQEWISKHYYGLHHGPVVLMIENFAQDFFGG